MPRATHVHAGPHASVSFGVKYNLCKATRAWNQPAVQPWLGPILCSRRRLEVMVPNLSPFAAQMLGLVISSKTIIDSSRR